MSDENDNNIHETDDNNREDSRLAASCAVFVFVVIRTYIVH
jgi:hypothetical protein